MSSLKKRVLGVMLLLYSPLLLAQADVNFSGNLVAEPCTLAPEDTNLTVDFGTVILKSLYSDKKSLPRLFTLHLIDCDLSLGNHVQVIFSGSEDADQPGLLALDSGSSASGIAIGLQTLKGEPVAINKQSPAYDLHDGTNIIHIAAYVQASDTAMTHHQIIPGDFSAVATFEFIYD